MVKEVSIVLGACTTLPQLNLLLKLRSYIGNLIEAASRCYATARVDGKVALHPQCNVT